MCCFKIYSLQDTYKKWKSNKLLYEIGDFREALKGYEEMKYDLFHEKEFLFEYGECLSKIGEFKNSNQVLKRATKLTCDPVIWNLMGKNYQALQEYKSAEKCFFYSAALIPSRLYPYYLLGKLYYEIEDKENFYKILQVMNEKKIKVESSLTEQMRFEIQTLKSELESK